MQILIKQARILNAGSPHHNSRKDILIEDGFITSVRDRIKQGKARVMESDNLHVSAGFTDIGTQIGEPGFEQRETLETVSRAGVAGGYTTLACFPNTQPPIDNKSDVSYIIGKSANLPIDIRPVGAVSVHCEGLDIAEMIDMHFAGAVAFSDGRKTIADAGLMQRAMLYAKQFGGTIIHKAIDPDLKKQGVMHEGKVSAGLGLLGIPEVAETILVDRDIQILEYTMSRLHLYAISSAGAVQKTRQAKRRKLDLTASVPALNLLLNDSVVTGFESAYKVDPPLRTKSDITSLIKGLREGTIDAIISNHEPVEKERKALEFTQAENGASSLETTFSTAWTALEGKVALETVIARLTSGPRAILGLEPVIIDRDKPANLCLFDPDIKWTLAEEDLHSRSKNNPLIGFALKGKVLGTVCKSTFNKV